MKKIFLQLFREFRIPLLISIGWTIYGSIDQPLQTWLTFKTVNTAFVTFFALSFWSGQWNRVRKQLRMDDDLSKIDAKASQLLKQLDEKTENLISHIIGGDSYCFGRYTYLGDQWQWMFFHKGTQPLHNVEISIYDMSRPTEAATTITRFNIMRPGRSYIGDPYFGNFPEVQSFNLFFKAENGNWQQEIRRIESPKLAASATRVIRKGTAFSSPLYCVISPDYPGETPIDQPWKPTPGLKPLG